MFNEMEAGENDSAGDGTAHPAGRCADDRAMHRRHVLLAAGVLGSVTAIAVAGADGAGADGAGSGAVTGGVVWRLDADWGYPRGPHGKTRLVSNASRRAAVHRYALTHGDAEAMNLHKCSFAPALAVAVDAESFDQLWSALSYEWTNPSTGQVVRIFDDRHADRTPQGTTLLANAFSPHTPHTPHTVHPATAAPAGSAPRPTHGPTTSTGPAGSPGAGSPASSSPAAGLAFTGSTVTTAMATGVGAVAAGIAALRLRRTTAPD